MTNHTPKHPDTEKSAPDAAPVREAKGAAQETIGKLLGDDQAVRDGRQRQRDAAKQRDDGSEGGSDGARDTKNPKQEQE